MVEVSIVVPIHNEEDNIEVFTKNITSFIKKNNLDWEIILAEAHSTDSSPVIVDRLAKKYKNIKAIHRRGKKFGFGYTLIDGTKIANGKYILWTMADGSDDIRAYKKIVDKLKEGNDIVIGSRYAKKGSPGDQLFFKKVFSYSYSKISKILLGISINDVTNAFRGFDKKILKIIKLESGDFSISPEMTLKAARKNLKLSEVPVIYKERKKGNANFRILKTGKHYLKLLFIKH